MLVVAIDIAFLKELKVRHKAISWTDIFHAMENFGSIGSWLLLVKDVARETKNGEIRVVVYTIFGIKCIHSIIVWGQTSEGGNVDDEHRLAFVIAQVYHSFLHDVHETKIVNRRFV